MAVTDVALVSTGFALDVRIIPLLLLYRLDWYVYRIFSISKLMVRRSLPHGLASDRRTNDLEPTRT